MIKLAFQLPNGHSFISTLNLSATAICPLSREEVRFIIHFHGAGKGVDRSN